MSHNTTLTFTTLNVRGCGGSKSDSVLQNLRSSNAKIILPQETHLCSQDTINKISKNWDGKSFWSPRSPGRSGVAILHKKDFNFQLLDSKQDLEGRVMSILIS